MKKVVISNIVTARNRHKLFLLIEMLERADRSVDYLAYPYIGQIRQTSADLGIGMHESTGKLLVDKFNGLEALTVFVNNRSYKFLERGNIDLVIDEDITLAAKLFEEQIFMDELLSDYCYSIIMKRKMSKQRKSDFLLPIKKELDLLISEKENALFTQKKVSDELEHLDDLTTLEFIKADLMGV